MKLIDLLEVTNTFHFAISVVGRWNDKYKIVDYHTHEYDNYEVIGISATAEVEPPSVITHSVNVRPIVLITLKEAKVK